MRKLTGAGLSFKKSAEVIVSNNDISHCATGLLANSPLDPENRMKVKEIFLPTMYLGYIFMEKKADILFKEIILPTY